MMTEEDCAKFFSQPEELVRILLMDKMFEGGKILEKSSNFSAQVRKAGNELFQQRNHDETIHSNTLFYYTKCIALAPKGSEELALGYSNRSVLLKHLQRYEECVIDVDKADAITKSDQLKKKLQTRKEECLAILSNLGLTQANLEESIKNLSLHCNKDENDIRSKFLEASTLSDVLPDASDSVGLNYNKTFGRHLIATRDIKPGEVIIYERGYICFPYNDKLYLACSHCLQFSWNAIPCDHCAYAVYCSETCKKEAWKEYHDEECSILPYFYFLSKRANIVDVMATTRLLIKAIKKEGLDNVLNEAKISNERKSDSKHELLSDGILHNNKFRSYCNLMYNKKRISDHPKDKFEYYELAAINLICRCTNLVCSNRNQLEVSSQEGKILIELKHLFVNLRNVFNTNAIQYQGSICNCPTALECGLSCPTRRGLIIGPCSSLVNHSCNPNVEKMCVPPGKIVLFSTAPIKKGEQICESYGALFTTEKAKRQNLFQEHFFFSCKCTACTENWPTYEEMDFCKDPKTDHVLKLKTFSKYEKELFNKETSSMFDKIVKKLEFDAETLEHAITFSEWVYKHYEKGMAFMLSITYRTYIDTAFYKLFGEKCIMPATCR